MVYGNGHNFCSRTHIYKILWQKLDIKSIYPPEKFGVNRLVNAKAYRNQNALFIFKMAAIILVTMATTYYPKTNFKRFFHKQVFCKEEILPNTVIAEIAFETHSSP